MSTLRYSLLALLPVAPLLTACTAPERGPEPVARALSPAHARLASDGTVEVGGERYDLDDPQASAALGLRLKAVAAALPAEAPTLVLACERGTPFARVELLMAVLEAAQLEDYRLDLGR